MVRLTDCTDHDLRCLPWTLNNNTTTTTTQPTPPPPNANCLGMTCLIWQWVITNIFIKKTSIQLYFIAMTGYVQYPAIQNHIHYWHGPHPVSVMTEHDSAQGAPDKMNF